MRKHLSTILLILVFLTGLSLLLYPIVSDARNSMHQFHAIVEYTQQVSEADQALYDQMRADAQAYNETLSEKENRYVLSDEERAEYENLLNVSGSGMIGYIEIPAIRCSLPICHGTDESVLRNAVGHIEGTSLPVGGAGTHCVLSGHRGLPSARLFTELDQVERGDVFLLHVLDETLTYEVDQILIVEPDELDALESEEGKDYCTLVTCTPYGVNSHRLLVRGHRVENQEESQTDHVAADVMPMEPVFAAPLVLLLLLVWILAYHYRKNRKL